MGYNHLEKRKSRLLSGDIQHFPAGLKFLKALYVSRIGI